MPTPIEVAEKHYATQVRRAEATLILTRRLWRGMDGDDLDASWAKIAHRLTVIVSAAQLGAAKSGAAYVPAALDSDPETFGEVVPARWAGVASDGRDLGSLLYSSVVHTRARLGAGDDLVRALQAGGKWLDMAVRTQLADADRGAAGVAITARESVGYVRYVSPPCCQDCAILAGRWYRWSAGFQRHHRCDCRHLPARDREIPAGYKADIDPAEIHDLTIAQQSAIAEGADVNQVVNSRRGAAKDRMTTAEGVTRRGFAGQRGAKQRLTPEGIYQQASSREDAIVLLKQHGYLI